MAGARPFQSMCVRSIADRPALEWMDPNQGEPYRVDVTDMSFQDVGTDDTYLFNQYLLCLYASIFITKYTASDLIDCWRATCMSLRDALNNKGDRFVRDPYLKAFFKENLECLQCGASLDSLPDPTQLRMVAQRVASERTMDTSFLYTILFLSGYPGAQTMEGNFYTFERSSLDNTTLVFIPTRRLVLNGDQRPPRSEVPSALWRLICSIQCSPRELIHTISHMALRLEVGLDRRSNGIPFVNKIAMLRLAKRLRKAQASATGTPNLLRDLLDKRVVQFYRGDGIGVSDGSYAAYLFDALVKRLKQEGVKVEDITFVNQLRNLVFGVPYGSSDRATVALEASKDSEQDPTPDEDFPEDEEDDTPEEQDPAPEEETSTPEADPENPEDENASSPDDGNKDNITSAAQPVPAESSAVGTLIALASGSETLDDLLYKLAVLHRCTALLNSKNSDVPPETLEMLRVWCSQYLFLASADATKSFLSQLKMSGINREFAR